MEDDYIKRVTDAILQCFTVDDIAGALKQLATDATNEQDEEMWLQALGILNGEGEDAQSKLNDEFLSE